MVLKYFLNPVNSNLFYLNIQLQEFCKIHGGKIREKANALFNKRDSINFMLNKIRYPRQYYKRQKLNLRSLEENVPFLQALLLNCQGRVKVRNNND